MGRRRAVAAGEKVEMNGIIVVVVVIVSRGTVEGGAAG